MPENSNKKVDKCPFCKRSFGLTLWRHNCTVCNRVVCDDCMPEKPVPNSSSKARVCSVCSEGGPSGSNGAGGSGSGARPTGTAHTLGGGGTQGSAEEERQKRIRALEERMKAQQTRGRPTAGAASSSTPSPAPQQPTNTTTPAPRVETVSQPTSQEEGQPVHAPTSAPAGNNPVLEAAQRRQEQLQKQRVGNSDGSSRNSAEKTQLLNEIFRLLQQRNEDEPFGLRGMDEMKLKLYLKHLREGK